MCDHRSPDLKNLLIRYTIGGNVSAAGFEIFRLSVRKIKRLFGNTADIFICYNGIAKEKLQGSGLKLVDQSEFANSLPYDPIGVAWKLYPPRLRIDCHEIFIDNDIVLNRIPPEITSYLSNKKSFFYTEGLHRCNGRFDWPKGIKFNSGLFGIPPYFDFSKELLRRMTGESCWTGYFDEQGLVGQTIIDQNNVYKIGLSNVGIFDRDYDCSAGFDPTLCGFHFVSANQGYDICWKNYKATVGL